MTTASERIRALKAKGALGEHEADSLLDAMTSSGETGGTGAPKGAWARLADPFANLSTGPALALGCAFTLASLVLGVALRVRFDGFLDLHVVARDVTWRDAVRDQLAAVAPFVILWGAARFAARGLRAIDFLAAVMLSRLAPAAMAAPLALLMPRTAGALPTPSVGLAVGVLVALVGVVLQITWLWRGFRTASGLAGARGVRVFLATLVVAEIVSKAWLYVSG